VLLTKVVVGKGYKMLRDSPSVGGPPPGYDSVSCHETNFLSSGFIIYCQVLAEVGASLNYDELVVYTEDAVRPSYLVMYDKV
jgi:hypothetical protein